MPRTAVALQELTSAGVQNAGAGATEPAADTTNGNFVVNDGRVFIQARASTANARTITFLTSGTVDGQAIGDRVVNISASTTKIIGPFPVSIYSQTLEFDASNVDVLLVPLHVGKIG